MRQWLIAKEKPKHFPQKQRASSLPGRGSVSSAKDEWLPTAG